MTPPLVIGSASRDLTSDDPRGWRLGGAAAYVGLTLARLGLRPRVVMGVDPDARDAEELSWLTAAGADLHLVLLLEGPVFTNRQTAEGRIQTCETPGDPLTVEAVPEPWRDARTWCLVPVTGEIDERWAAAPPEEAFVAVGWQGLLRTLPRGGIVQRRPARASALMQRADLVVLSREDVGPAIHSAELTALLAPSVTLVITEGEAGGVSSSLDEDGHRRVHRYAAVPSEAVVDPTGAGDVFLAGMVAGRLGHPLAGSSPRAPGLCLAAALGSLAVEGPGLLGVPDGAAVAARLGLSQQDGSDRPSPPAVA